MRIIAVLVALMALAALRPARAAGKRPSRAASSAAGAAAAEAAPPPGSSPLADLKRSNAALDKLLGKRTPDWSPEAEAQRHEVKKLVDSFLDYQELSRRALGRHWDPLTQAQRKDFVETLRQLVERSYLREVHGNPDYDIQYDREQKTGNEADVAATLVTRRRGKKVKVALEYKLLFREGRWQVYDVITDDQSLLENYRAEFNKIITKDSFDVLLKKMKRKLEEKPRVAEDE